MTGRMKLRLVVAVALVGWARALSVRGVPEVQAYLAPHVPRDDDLACIISGTEAATLLQLKKQAPPSGVHRGEGGAAAVRPADRDHAAPRALAQEWGVRRTGWGAAAAEGGREAL